MIFISPPFGNYLSFQDNISVKGSYTLQPRPGLFGQILRTLRYSSIHGGWINKIGLRNPGIDYAIKDYQEKHSPSSNTIYSVAILEPEEIPILVKKIPSQMNLEINLSCPNAEKPMVVTGIHQFLHHDRKWCILKLSPHTPNENIDNYYQQGFRQFHCCNTLKTPTGGLSGPSLKPYTTKQVQYIRKKYPESTIIAGGGVENQDDIQYYRKQGADHISISTVWFKPWLAWKLI